MNSEYTRKTRDGMIKIINCFESNYRDYIENLGPGKAEQFDARMKVIDNMTENWYKLTLHYINLCRDTYKPKDELDRLNREIELGNWKCTLSDMKCVISGHWKWLHDSESTLNNLIASYKATHK